MSASTLSRRDVLGLVSAATAAAALPPLLSAPAHAQAAPVATGIRSDAAALVSSVEKAFAFQNFMMDAYAAGSTVRLAQSYSDEALGATAFTYDNAVSIHAYLASGRQEHLERARVLGEGLLYAQAHNVPVADGRFGQAYFVNVPAGDGSGAYVTPAAYPFFFYTSATGDQAWAGMALAQLYRRTRDPRFLNGALAVANWIVGNTYSTLGAGGYSFGTNINPQNQSVPSTNGKSTEHNIDVYAFFTMLSHLVRHGTAANGLLWSVLAQHAFDFVAAMYNPAGPYFYTGTLGDGITINPFPIPEDTQTWSFLAIGNPAWRGTIDWALANLQATDTAASPHTALTGTQRVTGLVFDTASLSTTFADPTAVWLEGTGHMIATLIARAVGGGESFAAIFADLSEASRLLTQSQHAQTWLGVGKTAGGRVIPQGLGLVAATGTLDTGFGYTYGPSLHIGATGWYLLGALAANPFQLGYRRIG